jgi:hypothetical protein
MSMDVRHDILRKAYSTSGILKLTLSSVSSSLYVRKAVNVLCSGCLIYGVQGDRLFFMILFHLYSDTEHCSDLIL